MKFENRNRNWSKKFADAFSGVWHGVVGQKSFLVHVPFAIAVIALGFFFQIEQTHWLFVAWSIGAVFAAELFNSAIEELAKAVTDEENDRLRMSLNIAGGAVLVTSLTAVVCGLTIFFPKFWSFFSDYALSP
jgi:diacylglycerol kinase